eukprot:GEMP01072937.1.p1 GENE.GEMP01072937.1~~GEMP01072937.1.p1  ORF type:complete len:182 (+),score=15.00 GEMP01072937.1:62-547(+)
MRPLTYALFTLFGVTVIGLQGCQDQTSTASTTEPTASSTEQTSTTSTTEPTASSSDPYSGTPKDSEDGAGAYKSSDFKEKGIQEDSTLGLGMILVIALSIVACSCAVVFFFVWKRKSTTNAGDEQGRFMSVGSLSPKSTGRHGRSAVSKSRGKPHKAPGLE